MNAVTSITSSARTSRATKKATSSGNYLDYLNDRGKYVDEWWKVVNFDDVASRFAKAKK
ncbi:MAG: Fe-Mn family superoxide dismutase [Candidatus Bathyarchaeia archaeon]